MTTWFWDRFLFDAPKHTTMRLRPCTVAGQATRDNQGFCGPMTSSADDSSKWIGRTETVEDDLCPMTAEAAAAVFDQPNQSLRSGTALPPLWHWFYFLSKAPQSKLGHDGHPQREDDGFMPPITYPRRMFAAHD